MSNILEDFPPGPLDYYRKKATFDWKKLKIFLQTEEMVKYEKDLIEELQKYPDFQQSLLSLTLDEERRKCNKEASIFKNIELISLPSFIENVKSAYISQRVLTHYCNPAYIKYTLSNNLFDNTIRTSGTSRHHHFMDDLAEGKISGCFCLTEIGHGSNTKGMRTRATYDKSSKQFILHSPDFEAAKCWVGRLGQTATHGVVFAQLYIDEKLYGLHSFVVPIRNPKTLLPYPGITVGDMGDKIGLNGIDNGFIIFDNYCIPRENLLNKRNDVTENGKYVTPFKDPNKRHGANLGALSSGRVVITGMAEAYGSLALTIAIRYAAVRKQFGLSENEELPILEYQSHQLRLLPYLSAAYVMHIFCAYLIETYYQFGINSILDSNNESIPDLGLELHAISSASKPVATWTFTEAVQQCREACGGHGYLKAAGIGTIRNEIDASTTYEGDNNVLIQQTSNWLLKFWPLIKNGQKIQSPLKSVDFLTDALGILKQQFKANSVEEMCLPETIIGAYQWLICYLLKTYWENLERSKQNGENLFWAKSQNQVFYAKNLSIVYVQHFILQQTLIVCNSASDINIKNVLLKLFALYGIWNLDKQLATFYKGRYTVGSKFATLLQESMVELCKNIKDDAVSLIDAIALPDCVLNSVLGKSDGKVYEHLKSSIFSNPNVMSRPSWWKEIVNENPNIICKL